MVYAQEITVYQCSECLEEYDDEEDAENCCLPEEEKTTICIYCGQDIANKNLEKHKILCKEKYQIQIGIQKKLGEY